VLPRPHSRFKSRGNTFSYVSKFFAFGVFVFLLLKFFPSIAEELSGSLNPERSTSAESVLAPPNSNDLELVENQSDLAETDSSEPPTSIESPPALESPEPLPSPSPSETPVEVLEKNDLLIRLPSTLAVDPRTKSILLDSAFISGSQYVLICVDAPSLRILTASMANNPSVKVVGNGTGTLRISGETNSIQSFFKTGDGIRFESLSGSILSKIPVFRFIPVSKPSVDSKLCEKVVPANVRTLSFRALGIGLGIRKGEVVLKQ
jgi:hypothetical protein